MQIAASGWCFRNWCGVEESLKEKKKREESAATCTWCLVADDKIKRV
jgi:hypothetical protein